MALPRNISAYEDCFELFERASADPKGARALIGTFDQVKRYQLRMNTARALQREESMRIYPRDDTRHGKSEFDYLKVTVREDTEHQWWVYVEPHREDVVVIQGLSELDKFIEGDFEEIKSIEHKPVPIEDDLA